jgi:hypothetical protein
VGLRRLVFSRRELQRFQSWLDERLLTPVRHRLIPSSRPAGERPSTLGRLFDARERARTRRPEAPSEPPPVSRASRTSPARPTPPPAAKPSVPPPDAQQQDAPPPANSNDSLARLREAKKRANKR